MSNPEMSNSTVDANDLWNRMRRAWARLSPLHQHYLVTWAEQLAKGKR